ncbi:MAG: hypothetical protein ABL882_11745 [Sphingopyxis sp.]
MPHVKAKVAVSRVLVAQVEQVAQAAHRVQAEANQRVRLSQPVQGVVQCHRVRSIAPAVAVANFLIVIPAKAGIQCFY